MNELARKVHRTLKHLEKVIRNEGETDPYTLAIRLEDEITVWTDC